ncbi:hypothetical protein [Parenemella sanctibonifatiensis]|nr:hypothetical protein [Parenemella sanctibonifatiensis]
MRRPRWIVPMALAAALVLGGCRMPSALQPNEPEPEFDTLAVPAVEECGQRVREPLTYFVMSWECDIHDPGRRAGQGEPPIPLEDFAETGRTAQGFAIWHSVQDVYQATNVTHEWEADVYVIDVPAGALGDNERMAVAFFAEVQTAPWLEEWVLNLTLTA